jgi:hypothetical protein
MNTTTVRADSGLNGAPGSNGDGKCPNFSGRWFAWQGVLARHAMNLHSDPRVVLTVAGFPRTASGR